MRFEINSTGADLSRVMLKQFLYVEVIDIQIF
jgi:hypothetical protein